MIFKHHTFNWLTGCISPWVLTIFTMSIIRRPSEIAHTLGAFPTLAQIFFTYLRKCAANRMWVQRGRSVSPFFHHGCYGPWNPQFRYWDWTQDAEESKSCVINLIVITPLETKTILFQVYSSLPCSIQLVVLEELVFLAPTSCPKTRTVPPSFSIVRVSLDASKTVLLLLGLFH